MIIRYKKLDSNVPDLKRYSKGAAAFDLCTTININGHWGDMVIPTGIAIEIPEGYFGLLTLRSSAAKYMTMKDGAGIIDSDYRGEIKVLIHKEAYFKPHMFLAYSRIAQLTIIPTPNIAMEQSEQLSITERGEKGLGSTGN